MLCLFAPQAVRNFAQRMFGEFRAPIDSIPSHLSDLEKYWSLHSNSKRALIEAGRDLARLNASYELKLLENGILKERLERYEKILQMPSYEKFKSEIARVIRRDINAWWQYLTIRKGSSDGIRKGYAVIYSGGVVGRVVRVESNTAQVELVGSSKFRMAAHVLGDERPVIYQGLGSLALRGASGEVTDVPADLYASPAKPLKLVTSALAGSFPEGIPIGDVVSLKLDSDGIFKTGQVRLSGDISNIREVTVLIPVSELSDVQ